MAVAKLPKLWKPRAVAFTHWIFENQVFDQDGPTSRVFLRPFNGGADQPLAIAGRVTDVLIAPDGVTFYCVT